jgi:hypothetical protein
MAGGSDSHGDLNFRRYGRPGNERWTDVPVGDTAIGNPRNLVTMAQPQGGPPVAAADTTTSNGPLRYSNQAVIASLRAGRFSVTDGPAIRIAIDRNLNGVIDDVDIPMGGTFDDFPGDRIPLLVEWLSTPEFGPIARVDVRFWLRTFGAFERGERNETIDNICRIAWAWSSPAATPASSIYVTFL